MHYLEGPFDSALGKISQYLVPDHQYKSVHDYFNPQLFHSALIAILPNIPTLTSQLDSLFFIATQQEADTLGSNSGFIEVRIRNFTAIWNSMQSALTFEGHEVAGLSKQQLFTMVKDYDLDCLQHFLQHLFELLIKHHGAVQYITELPSQDQATIKDFLQRAKVKFESHRISSAAKEQEEDEVKRLEEQNNQLRLMVNSKEVDLQKLSINIEELIEQIEEFKEMETLKETEIDSLKKQLLAYQQTDTLFQEKDQEILKLHKTVESLQMANKLLNSELTTEKTRQDSKILELEQNNAEIMVRLQKLNATLDLVSKQRQEIETSNKKVIANLKEKIRSQTERIGDLQNQLVETKIGRELRQRQFSQLWSNYESLRSQSLNQSSGRIAQPQMTRVPSSSDFDKGIISSSGNHREFLRLGEQINELDKFQDNAFEEQIMMFESGEDNLKKVQQIINENSKLKEKLALLESKGGSQDSEKLKKKIAVMKKRNEQLQTQRREELDLMVSAFEHCLRNRPEY